MTPKMTERHNIKVGRAAADAAAPDSGRMAGGAHHLAMRVYWEDTDASGIVYYANYLKFIERGRSALLRHLGIDQPALWRDGGLAFVVRRCVIDYHSPARLDDLIEVETRLGDLSGAAVELLQKVRRSDAKLASAVVKLACIDRNGRPQRLPAVVKTALATI